MAERGVFLLLSASNGEVSLTEILNDPAVKELSDNILFGSSRSLLFGGLVERRQRFKIWLQKDANCLCCPYTKQFKIPCSGFMEACEKMKANFTHDRFFLLKIRQ